MYSLLVSHTLARGIRGSYALAARLLFFQDAVVFDMLEHARRTMADASPVRSGALRSGWRVRRLGYAEGGLYNTEYYTLFQFTGSAAHTITPKNKAVRFYSGGSVIFRGGSFEHPGQDPNEQLLSALFGEKAYVEDRLAQLGMQVTVTTPALFGGGPAGP